MMSSTFAYAYWAFVYFLQRNIYSETFPIFELDYSSFCYWDVRALYTLQIQSLVRYMIHHYLPLYLRCHFTFWIVSLKHILLILMKFNLHIYFLLLFMLLVSYIRIHCQIWASRYTPTFSSKKFIVLDPQFRFLTQVNFDKYYKVRVQFHSLHVAGLSRCCSSVCGKDSYFPI